jgi:hypothetical protein
MPTIINSGFCYDLHETAPQSVDCLASWISLMQGIACISIFIHLMRKLLRSHKRALAGYAKNTINIASHAQAFSGVIIYYILWGIECTFDINREYKYKELTSPGIHGTDINVLLPYVFGSMITRGFSNFLEWYIILLIVPDDIGNDTFKLARNYAAYMTMIYVPFIFAIIMWCPGKSSIYWPLENIAILYAVRDFIMIVAHTVAYWYAKDLKVEALVNRTMRTYLSYMALIYTGFFLARICYLTSNFTLINLGICADDIMRFVQFGTWGPLAYLTLKRNCQYWATDLDLEENEETLKSHTESITWGSDAAKWNCVIPKSEIYFRKTLEERMDISVELHFWRRRMAVVKRFKFDLLTRENIQLFKNEATVFRELIHPNIVDFYGVLVDPPSLGIVMKYAKNGDLVNYLEKQLKKRKERISMKVQKRKDNIDNGDSDNDESDIDIKSPGNKVKTELPIVSVTPTPLSPAPTATPGMVITTPSPLESSSSKSSFFSRSLSAIKSMSSPNTKSIEMLPIKKNEFNPFICALQIANGMHYLHEKNFNHRDLKSPNILLDENYTALIADFGESKISYNVSTKQMSLIEEFAGVSNADRSSTSGRGSISLSDRFSFRGSLGGGGTNNQQRAVDPAGTPGWAAPECVLEKGSNRFSDCFHTELSCGS